MTLAYTCVWIDLHSRILDGDDRVPDDDRRDFRDSHVNQVYSSDILNKYIRCDVRHSTLLTAIADTTDRVKAKRTCQFSQCLRKFVNRGALPMPDDRPSRYHETSRLVSISLYIFDFILTF